VLVFLFFKIDAVNLVVTQRRSIMPKPFLDLIGSPQFIHFISTFGLAVVIVIYFVFFRDPKQAKYWQNKYDELSDNYRKLGETYRDLESTLRPETRKLSDEQANTLCNIAIDRDLYKLFHLICKRIDGVETQDISLFLQESIIDTTGTWAKFKSPFPQAPCIADLYTVYSNNGAHLKTELEEIMEGDQTEEEKKQAVWNKLCENTLNMKREFSDNLRKLREGKAVEPVTVAGEN
jgi:hypothetical protein